MTNNRTNRTIRNLFANALAAAIVMLLAVPFAFAQIDVNNIGDAEESKAGTAASLPSDKLGAGLILAEDDSEYFDFGNDDWEGADIWDATDGYYLSTVTIQIGTLQGDFANLFASSVAENFATDIAAGVVTVDASGTFELSDISFVGQYNGGSGDGEAIGFLYVDTSSDDFSGTITGGANITVVGISSAAETTSASGVVFADMSSDLVTLDGAEILFGNITVVAKGASSSDDGGEAFGFQAGSTDASEITLGTINAHGYDAVGGVRFGRVGDAAITFDATVLTINSINAVAVTGEVRGIQIFGDVSDSTIDISGGITATAREGRAVGFAISGDVEDTEINVGDVTATAGTEAVSGSGTNAQAVHFLSTINSTETITFGNITATTYSNANGAYAFTARQGISSEVILGDVRAFARGTASEAIAITVYDGDVSGKLTVNSLTAFAAGDAIGITVTPNPGADDIAGDLGSATNPFTILGAGGTAVDVKSTGTGDAMGVWVAGANKDLYLHIGGSVDAEASSGRAVGIGAEGNVTITLTNDVTINAVGTTADTGGIVAGGNAYIDLANNDLTVTGGVFVQGQHRYASIAGSTVTIDSANARGTTAYGFLVADTSTNTGTISNSTIVVDKINAGGTSGAAGFAVWGNTSNSHISLGEEGGITVNGGSTWAVGAHFAGNVTGSSALTLGDITVNSGANEAQGLQVEGNLAVATTVGAITVNTGTAGNAFGIRAGTFSGTHPDVVYTAANISDLTLTKDITVNGHGVETSGIRAGTTNIKLDGNVTIAATKTDGGTYYGAAIWTDGNLNINLQGNTLNTTTGGVKVDDGNNLSITSATAATANLGVVTLNGVGGVFTVGENVTANVAAGSTFGSQTVVQTGGTLATAGGTIDRLIGNGSVTASGNLTIGGTVDDIFTGTVNAATNTLTLNGGRYSGNLTASTTTVNAGATLVTGASGMNVTGALTMVNGSTLQVGMLGVTDTALTVTSAATITTIDVDLVGWANFDVPVGEDDITYTLIDANSMTFTTPAKILVNGEDISGNTRLAESISVSNVGANLVLTISQISSLDLVWKAGGGTWGISGGEWEDDETFVNNDNVTFGIEDEGNGATFSIEVVSGGVNVGTMNVIGNNNWTFTDGNITGTGELTKDGEGDLVFGNNVSFIAGIDLNEGTIEFQGTVAGNIATAADTEVVFNNSGILTFEYNIIGDGLTTIKDGTFLLAEGKTIAGDVNVESGATLGGAGSIGGMVIVKDGAFLSPGMSPGTLTVGSILFKTGSTYLFELGDSLMVSSTGTVEIESEAKLKLIGTTPGTEGEARVITAAASQFHATDRVFDFDPTSTWATTVDIIGVRDDGYWISWITTSVDNFAELVEDYASPNAYNVANGMDRILDKTDIQELYDALQNMSADDPKALADAFAQLHGEMFAASQIASVSLQNRFVQLVPSAGDRLLSPQEARATLRGQVPGALWNRWGALTGDWLERNKLQEYSGYTLQTFGVVAGLDRRIGNNILTGGAIAYDNTYQDFRSINSKDRVNSLRALLYSGWRYESTYVDGYAGYSKNWHETERNINIDDVFSTTAKGKYGDDMLSAGIEVGRKFYVGSSQFIPSVGLHYVHLSTPAITETGGGDANLYIRSNQYDSLRLPLGVRWNCNFTWGYGIVWTPEVRAFYVGELADTTTRIQTSFDRVRNVSFLAESGDWGSHSGRLGLGLNTQWSNRLNFRLDYDLEVYEHTAINRFGAALGWNW